MLPESSANIPSRYALITKIFYYGFSAFLKNLSAVIRSNMVCRMI